MEFFIFINSDDEEDDDDKRTHVSLGSIKPCALLGAQISNDLKILGSPAHTKF